MIHAPAGIRKVSCVIDAGSAACGAQGPVTGHLESVDCQQCLRLMDESLAFGTEPMLSRIRAAKRIPCAHHWAWKDFRVAPGTMGNSGKGRLVAHRRGCLLCGRGEVRKRWTVGTKNRSRWVKEG